MTRISCDKDDPSYWRFCEAQADGKKVLIFLNGVEVSHCLMADEELGFVVRCVLDGSGNIQIDPANPYRISVERVTGAVEIKLQ
jgi:hypothetical protein